MMNRHKPITPASTRPIIFNFLVLLLINLFPPPSISTPCPTIPTKRNVSSFLSYSDSDSSDQKLRRVPHVFSKVLELPFNSDADVSVEERPDCFRFAVECDWEDDRFLKAVVVESHPGVNKVVVRGGCGDDGLMIDQLEVDVWRARLPETARLEETNVTCHGGLLVIIIPYTSNLLLHY